MRFGLFYEHQFPRPWAPGGEGTLLRNALDQIEIADRVGFDHLWEVEHHFLEEYSHSSAPEVFLAAASQRTKRIRLGHGIVQLPVGFNHPARIAERIATLDLVSNGRVEFGTGESSSQMELGGFGVPREEKRDQWDEALDAITRMFVEEPFAGYDGRWVSMPPRNVVPKPQQKPHPPIWVACSRRETILLAARKGIGALSFSFIEPEEAKEWADEYYRIISSDECVPAGFAVNPNFAVVVPLMTHEDEQTAIDRGVDGAHFFGYSLAHYYVFGNHEPARTNVYEEFLEHRAEYGFARELVRSGDERLGVKILERGLGSMRGAVGTPKQIVDLVERYEAAGVDQVIFSAQNGHVRHEHVCEALELFGREVIPRFAEHADERDRAKRERLEEAMAAAVARREPPRVAPAGYVVTTAGEPSQARPLLLGTPASTEPSPEEQFAAALRGKSDDELEDLAAAMPVFAMVFSAMASRFQPQYARGFEGDIVYDLASRDGAVRWTVRVDGDHAVAQEGAARDARVTLHTTVPLFLRILTGEQNPLPALLDGSLAFEGEVEVGMRLNEMFGASRF